MPKFDRTGPMGMGPRTGRGLGPCGFGRSLPTTKEGKLKALAEYRKALEEELEDVKAEEKAQYRPHI